MRVVLIYRLGSLGDTIVSLPCFHKVAQTFPDAQRILLTNLPVSPAAPAMADILLASGLVHGAIEYPLGLRSFSGLRNIWNRLKSVEADALIYLAAPRGRVVLARDIAFFRACGVKQIIGAPTSDDLRLNRIDPATGNEEHESERLARSLSGLGPINLRDRALWDLRLNEPELRAADKVSRGFGGAPFLAISMGGKAQENDWGEANWTALVNMAAGNFPALKFTFVGAKQDFARADAIASLYKQRCLNLCGELTPRETAAVLSRARTFAGHDSGPIHLAASCGIPCVGIFSNRHKPHKWHPYGDRIVVFHPSGPISSVPVAQVHDAIADALEAFPAEPSSDLKASLKVVQDLDENH